MAASLPHRWSRRNERLDDAGRGYILRTSRSLLATALGRVWGACVPSPIFLLVFSDSFSFLAESSQVAFRFDFDFVPWIYSIFIFISFLPSLDGGTIRTMSTRLAPPASSVTLYVFPGFSLALHSHKLSVLEPAPLFTKWNFLHNAGTERGASAVAGFCVVWEFAPAVSRLFGQDCIFWDGKFWGQSLGRFFLGLGAGREEQDRG